MRNPFYAYATSRLNRSHPSLGRNASAATVMAIASASPAVQIVSSIRMPPVSATERTNCRLVPLREHFGLLEEKRGKGAKMFAGLSEAAS